MSADEFLEYDEVRLNLSHEAVGGGIRGAVDEGWYEAHEARLVGDYLPTSTAVIEFGAGIGLVCDRSRPCRRTAADRRRAEPGDHARTQAHEAAERRGVHGL